MTASQSPSKPGFRSGFVAVVGRPNVGKSTLVNALVGGKVAIVSDKPQTTRSAVRGIFTSSEAQLVFVDTPGYHKPRTLLGKRLNEVVRTAWSDVDLALLVVDGDAGIGRGDEKVAADLRSMKRPTFCVVNKLDRLPKPKVAQALTAAAALGDFEEYVPVSALKGDGVDLLRELVVARMPEGPMYYPPDANREQPPPMFVAELVREKLLTRTREELPHSIAVVTEEFAERDDGLLEIQANVFVERESQKGIVIGKGGHTLKAVGTEAREEIEALFGRHVFLDLRVKVEPDWQRRAQSLDRLGFTRD
ncbi:MAG TPA: GTPase Era [Actinomycetota bacterium]|nr:GTPase Era [Actinomycetota bacterium]